MRDASAPDLVQVDGLKMYFPVYSGVLRRHSGDIKAVDDVSFTIRAGETLGLGWFNKMGNGRIAMPGACKA